jgi:hypothetical protein
VEQLVPNQLANDPYLQQSDI